MGLWGYGRNLRHVSSFVGRNRALCHLNRNHVRRQCGEKHAQPMQLEFYVKMHHQTHYPRHLPHGIGVAGGWREGGEGGSVGWRPGLRAVRGRVRARRRECWVRMVGVAWRETGLVLVEEAGTQGRASVGGVCVLGRGGVYPPRARRVFGSQGVWAQGWAQEGRLEGSAMPGTERYASRFGIRSPSRMSQIES